MAEAMTSFPSERLAALVAWRDATRDVVLGRSFPLA